MTLIINNSRVADESKVRINNAIMYFPDPRKSGPLSFARVYFGLPGRDPMIVENQKKVYVLQEDGSAVSIDQPVICSAGGVPEYLGSQVSLAVSGSYSMAVTDKTGNQEYYLPSVESANFQGFSGVIVEEPQTITGGSLTLTYGVIEATTATFLISKNATGTEFKGSYLELGKDYKVNSPTSITLTANVSDGTVVIGRQMDPTGQIIPVSDGLSGLFVARDIATVKKSDLKLGDTVTINGGIVPNDGLGGNKFLVVAGGTHVADDVNYIELNNGNQLEAVKNSLKLAVYSEVTNTSESVSGNITLDLDKGNVHDIILTENVAAILFTHANPDKSLTTTVSLKITQDAVTARTITWSSNIKWSGGNAPVMSPVLGSYDRYVFVSDNGGSTWDGALMGANFS